MKLFSSLIYLTLCVSLSAQTPSAQDSTPLKNGSAKSVGMSTERLARIDTMAESAIADRDVPGLVALVARNGKIVYHKAFGVADAGTGRELKEDGIFRIFSQTKAITATAVMMLWEEGLFKLDDPISKWIPEFKPPRSWILIISQRGLTQRFLPSKRSLPLTTSSYPIE